MSPYKRIDPNEQLERIAQAIRLNPEITVQELKKQLGYAQEKSIYYWLQKSPYKGIKKFRQAVLTGQYHPGYPLTSEPFGHFAEAPGRNVPLAVSFTSEGKAETVGQMIPALLNYSNSAFAFRVETNEYFPTLSAGDLLIVDPEERPKQGTLVLALLKTQPQVFRFYPGQPSLLIHPANPLSVHSALEQDSMLLGQVVELLRLFS